MLNLFGEDVDAPEKRIPKNRAETFNDYDGFVDKFKPKKTTDDCYAPAPVYDKIKEWVNDNILPLDGVRIVRPFYPGGDYEAYDYPPGCLVLDNPPFSILAKIRRFYHARGIRYFLFAPGLTMGNSAKELWNESTYIVCDGSITYENGAHIATGFITNLDCGETGIWVSGSLQEAIKEGNRIFQNSKNKSQPVYEFPPNVTSFARLQKLAVSGVEFRIDRQSMCPCTKLESMARCGKKIYGGGWLVSNNVAAEISIGEIISERKKFEMSVERKKFEMSVERKKAKRERAVYWEISEAERSIISKLK